MTPSFSDDFQAELRDLMRWRRDVRRFRTGPVEAAVLDRCLCAFTLAPSVGLSEPWRVIDVTSDAARAAAIANFKAANANALAGYCDEKANLYASLKLSGMQEAPIHLAIYSDDTTPKGAGLGAITMPEMRAYSVVGAITLFWLLARAEGLGVGWVSILNPVQLAKDLNTPTDWRLVGYLCVGWPETADDTPELERAGWETRTPTPIRESR
jgi:5,6-dimethylbenzimidazole synthase